ncbi:ATP-binding protein [Mycolicibacter icosiumassiliensis]|uniref:ATP-binding protein n=1 Tax=Mycolicibacter icosiumassiliensis TaxID=1792835 RepID=UPI001F413D61|nr:ATP-binding protein [Mycolicibacter icosiumassiliensis]
MRPGLADRRAETSALCTFLDAALAQPATLLLEGEAGIGKSTLVWEAAATERGYQVFSAVGAPTEVRYAYAAVADLLGGVDVEVAEHGSVRIDPAPEDHLADAGRCALADFHPAGVYLASAFDHANSRNILRQSIFRYRTGALHRRRPGQGRRASAGQFCGAGERPHRAAYTAPPARQRAGRCTVALPRPSKRLSWPRVIWRWRAISADPEVLLALDEAATVTQERGAPAVAAELIELAINLGGGTPVRRMRAAEKHFRTATWRSARAPACTPRSIQSEFPGKPLVSYGVFFISVGPMGDGESGRQCFLVEWYQPDLVEAAVDAAIDRLSGAAAAVRATLLVTLTSPSDETLFGVVAADSADAVVTACQQAGWHIDRITSGVRARIGAIES